MSKFNIPVSCTFDCVSKCCNNLEKTYKDLEEKKKRLLDKMDRFQKKIDSLKKVVSLDDINLENREPNFDDEELNLKIRTVKSMTNLKEQLKKAKELLIKNNESIE